YHATVVDVAPFADRHVEFELVVTAVRALLAQIPFETGGAQPRAGHAPLDRLLAGVFADADAAPLDDRVLQHHLVVVIEPLRHLVDEIAHHPVPAVRQIRGDAADPKPARAHAAAGDRFDDREAALAVGEHVEHRGELAEVLRVGAVEHQVAR